MLEILLPLGAEEQLLSVLYKDWPMLQNIQSDKKDKQKRSVELLYTISSLCTRYNAPQNA